MRFKENVWLKLNALQMLLSFFPLTTRWHKASKNAVVQSPSCFFIYFLFFVCYMLNNKLNKINVKPFPFLKSF